MCSKTRKCSQSMRFLCLKQWPQSNLCKKSREISNSIQRLAKKQESFFLTWNTLFCQPLVAFDLGWSSMNSVNNSELKLRWPWKFFTVEKHPLKRLFPKLMGQSNFKRVYVPCATMARCGWFWAVCQGSKLFIAFNRLVEFLPDVFQLQVLLPWSYQLSFPERLLVAKCLEILRNSTHKFSALELRIQQVF